MKTYFENQKFWLLIILTLPVILFAFLDYGLQWGISPMGKVAFVFTVSLLFLVYLLLYRMQIDVMDQKVKISFGVGLLSKEIDVSQIRSIRIVKGKWYYGSGIHLLSNGVIYNVNANDAVEILLKNGYRIHIGTYNPYALKKAIEEA